MSESTATVFAALIGAVLGSLGTQLFSDRLQRMRERRKTMNNLAQLYLLQVKDATRSLWFRLHNIAVRSGFAVMEDEYYVPSMLFALGSFLAYKRILLLHGTYSVMEEVRKGWGTELQLQLERLDTQLDRGRLYGRPYKFYRYDRLALAEALMRWDDGQSRLASSLEFRTEYQGPSPIENGMSHEKLPPPTSQGIPAEQHNLLLVGLPLARLLRGKPKALRPTEHSVAKREESLSPTSQALKPAEDFVKSLRQPLDTPGLKPYLMALMMQLLEIERVLELESRFTALLKRIPIPLTKPKLYVRIAPSSGKANDSVVLFISGLVSDEEVDLVDLDEKDKSHFKLECRDGGQALYSCRLPSDRELPKLDIQGHKSKRKGSATFTILAPTE
jgi:hypothetical protein